ncbi:MULTISPECIES: hypothetical protein [Bacillus cereus group]|uniref:hypothetical protein n=1 Tax=Bacillus cereus group TaxID=86661 RepID=UPI001E3D5368|nr:MULTISPECIES: hypothetical protein [Bacillus cereus group]MCC2412613.1 hypothetical protein [Bacillus paranthracis]MDA1824003.1 hypothetical protein [Bacillus cereus group sp. BY2-1LC]
MANNKLKINIDADTSEALKQMKEVTEAANECVVALSKLEQVMGNFTDQTSTVELYCDGKLVAQSLVKRTTDTIKISANNIQTGIVLDGKVTAESILRNIKESDVLKERF